MKGAASPTTAAADALVPAQHPFASHLRHAAAEESAHSLWTPDDCVFHFKAFAPMPCFPSISLNCWGLRRMRPAIPAKLLSTSASGISRVPKRATSAVAVDDPAATEVVG